MRGGRPGQPGRQRAPGRSFAGAQENLPVSGGDLFYVPSGHPGGSRRSFVFMGILWAPRRSFVKIRKISWVPELPRLEKKIFLAPLCHQGAPRGTQEIFSKDLPGHHGCLQDAQGALPFLTGTYGHPGDLFTIFQRSPGTPVAPHPKNHQVKKYY